MNPASRPELQTLSALSATPDPIHCRRPSTSRSRAAKSPALFSSPAEHLLTVLVAGIFVRGRAQVISTRPEDLPFQALLTAPIATPDRRSVMAGMSAVLVKDRQTEQCFVAVTIGNSMGLSPAACAP